ncbi:sulfite reductase (NADPH) alpha subunit [Salsuginibacillus halophilus]|uniref:assimilatory sulfite reductase (NADPH) n=1 Tax=Salsuginibacillus halophilus TaxID=517424 RepID=A0A2P8H9R4_9BACI|nr:assimilatory sulfite reductase (NADPH) flavoprotein subunit [Salsuginibacillus halophilus]PSL42958.1 sulfite reductase (NADPH) alpha subunit [Salsuginibacillus halophilus]
MNIHATNSPFTEDQASLLNQVLPSLSEQQRIWLSGYLTAAFAPAVTATAEPQPAPEAPAAAPTSAPKRAITLLIGSHTGNGQALAAEFKQKLQNKAFDVQAYDMDQFKPKQLKQVEDLLIITSTHGEGDPPDNALTLYEHLYSKKAPDLTGVRFSVLALGDSSYEFFCQTGIDFDNRLAELGAERLHDRVDCDVDFEAPAASWLNGVIDKLGAASPVPAAAEETAAAAVAEAPVYSKKNPFWAEVVENFNLNGRGSNKETRHLVLDLEGSGLTYEPGDALGLIPQNDPLLVDNIIAEAGWDPATYIQVDEESPERPLRDVLIDTVEITVLTKPLLQKAAEASGNPGLKELVGGRVKAYTEGRDLLDLMKDYGPWQTSAAETVAMLRKIPPRLYSIASSLTANPDEVHLTIGALRYSAHGRPRNGVCSVQCAERVQPGEKLPVFIQQNPNFKLPDDPETATIMIGAGTGIAPYRSFLEEREETEATGDNWVFFGDQHFLTDFLYQTEWQSWLQDGTLTHMDVAFSRDGTEKTYVQHKLLAQAEALYRWIEGGAYIYVCGDKNYMAKDVHEALTTVIAEQSGRSNEEAEAYLSDLRQEKRYQRDVY